MSLENIEKREFFRHDCSKPVIFKILLSPRHSESVTKMVSGMSKNLSVSGILFQSTLLPEISSILELEMDYRTMNICQEIEENAMMIGNKLIGKVVRIEETEDGRYNIGVAFIKKHGQLPPGIENMFVEP